MSSDWTEDEILKLKALVDAGVSYSEIGRQMGRTKNAVLGKSRRMGWGGQRGYPIRAKKERRPQAPKRTSGELTKKLSKAKGVHQLKAKTAGMRFRSCQWIDGLPSPDDLCKCGAPTERGSPWCSQHGARIYTTKDSHGDQPSE